MKPKRDHEVRFPDSFWRRGTQLPVEAKALYAVLATFADYKTGSTFVSNGRLQFETRFGRDRVERLLSELETAGFIKRIRKYRGNLLWKRWIRCLKQVSSDTLKVSVSARCPENQGAEKKVYIRTPVKSFVTPERQEESSFPHRSPTAERIM